MYAFVSSLTEPKTGGPQLRGLTGSFGPGPFSKEKAVRRGHALFPGYPGILKLGMPLSGDSWFTGSFPWFSETRQSRKRVFR